MPRAGSRKPDARGRGAVPLRPARGLCCRSNPSDHAQRFIRVGYHWIFLNTVPGFETFLAVGVLIFSNFSTILVARGDYRTYNLVNFRRQARDVTLTWTAVFLVILGVAFSLKIAESFSRGAMISFFVSGLCTLIAFRAWLAQFLVEALSGGTFAERRVILIAEQGAAISSRAVRELRRCGYNPVRTFEISEDELVSTGIPKTLRRTLDLVVEAARDDVIEDIFLLIGWQRTRCIERILNALRVLPLPVQLLPDEHVARYLSRPMVHLGETWSAELKRGPLTKAEQALKRGADFVLAFAGLIFVSPLLLIIAQAIRLDSRGPALFKQTRNGFNGRSFRIFKFRTMTVLEDGADIRQATRNDPRVTTLGHLLRRSSIDELPQLFNVLAGDMSLVGPRPHAVAHNTAYEQLIATYAFRYHVKPGITGWAQVNGSRGETRTVDLMEERVKLDLWYINNWSIWLDLGAPAVVGTRGPESQCPL
jgi:Undecaprenyl-phosphate glucose phosphotransferase